MRSALLSLLRCLGALPGSLLSIFRPRCVRSTLCGGIFSVVQKSLHLFQRILKHIFRRRSSTLDAGGKLQAVGLQLDDFLTRGGLAHKMHIQLSGIRSEIRLHRPGNNNLPLIVGIYGNPQLLVYERHIVRMGSAHIPGHRGQVVPVVIAWAGDVVDLRACFALCMQAGLRPKVHIFVFELN